MAELARDTKRSTTIDSFVLTMFKSYKDGVTIKELAKQNSLPYHEVRKRLMVIPDYHEVEHRGCMTSKVDYATLNKTLLAYKSGASLSEIAKDNQCSRQNVSLHLKKFPEYPRLAAERLASHRSRAKLAKLNRI